MTLPKTIRNDNPRPVDKSRPCPVCGGDHKCGVKADGLILCGRRSGPVAGFVHLGQAKDDPQWGLYRRDGDPALAERGGGATRRNGAHEPGRKRPPPDLARIAEECRGRLTPALRGELATALGLPASALAALPMIGWAAEGPHREPRGPCWTLPEVDAAGNVAGVVCRYRDGRKKAWPGGGRGLTVPAGWHGGDGPVFLPEGPSDVLALCAAGLAAVGRPSNMGGVEDLAGLLRGLPAGRPIVALGENDAKQSGEWPGRDGAEKTAARLGELLGRPVPWALPPDGAKDVRAWLTAQRIDPARPDAWAEAGRRLAATLKPAGRKGRGNDAGRDGRRPPKSAASRLIDLADGLGVQLFHDAEGGGYADVFAGEGAARRRETWPLRSKGFAVWLARSFHAACRRAPGSQAVADAVSALDGKARFDGPERPVHVRVAGLDGRIYLDLADAGWRAVELAPDGWKVVAEPPVRFRRPRGLWPLPEPARGGRLDALRPFVNLPAGADGDAAWRLLASWLVQALRPRGPYPLLCLHGEAGSAKSTIARVARSLIDPNLAALRAAPRDDRDLMIAASNGWCVALDNLSRLPDPLSDALCRLSTGGGYATRQLFTDGDEVLFDVQRPAVLTGVEDLAQRGDLAERALALQLPPIDPTRRRTEADFWRAFGAARPGALGALLDAVCGALREEAGVRLDRLPRMADFAVWACAAAPSLGWTAGDFLGAYEGAQADANEQALESSPLAEPLRRFLRERGGEWKGTAAELLAELAGIAGDKAAAAPGWPRKPNALSGRLVRLAPNLRRAGIDVERGREEGQGRRRYIRLSEQERSRKTSSLSSRIVPEGRNPCAGGGLAADDPDAGGPSEDRPRDRPDGSFRTPFDDDA